MLLIYGRKFLCVITLALFCCISLDAATVSVSVSPGGQTVKVKPANVAEEIGINTAEYNVSGTFDPSSLETNEVKPVDPVWNCTCSNVTFVPPVGVQPVPQNPGNPSVSISGTKPWVAKVSSPNAGQWKLQFKIAVTYDVLDKKTGEKKPNEKFGPYEGTGECTFIATSKPWKVTITPEKSVVCRKATALTQKVVPYKKATAKLVDADSAKTVVVSSSGGGVLRFGLSANAENVTNTTLASLSLTIPKDGSKDFYVSGETESLKTGDVLITATSTDAVPEIVGSTNMTVLWVVVSLKTEGKMSSENTRKEFFAFLNEDWVDENVNKNDAVINQNTKYDLFKRHIHQEAAGEDKVVYGVAYEVSGRVKPDDFREEVILTRDAECFAVDIGRSSPEDITQILENADEIDDIIHAEHLAGGFGTSVPGEIDVNDKSFDIYLDKIPPLIFDFDCPGYSILDFQGALFIVRIFNFREFAVYDNMRCSDVLEFNLKYAIHKIAGKQRNCVKLWEAEFDNGRYVPK